jgi:hypothetical protein
MVRRSFVLSLPILSAVVLAQEQPDRVSGVVRSADLKQMTIEVALRSQPNVLRKVLFDTTTKITMEEKPGQASDIKEGLRIVAVGKFEGVNLKATAISLRTR